MSKLQSLEKYLPVGSLPLVEQILENESVLIVLTRERSTKLGDYSFVKGKKYLHRISINHNLNPFSFLVTLLHEIAHMQAFKNAKKKADFTPHGTFWQAHYSDILKQFLGMNFFPPTIEEALQMHLMRPTAASCSDAVLMRALQLYDDRPDHKATVEEILEGDYFMYQGRTFKKGTKFRVRYKCLEVKTNREYRFHALAEVSKYEV